MKERLWREKGAVAVDMETSALFSVSKCLGVKVASVLMASDSHPLEDGGNKVGMEGDRPAAPGAV